MILFSQEIYKLINCALTDLTTSQTSGRTSHNALSEAHYIGAWITTAIKQKRFDSVVSETLKSWQNQARSLGKNAGLKEQFTQLNRCYKQVRDGGNELLTVNITQLNKLYAALSEQQWLVTTDLEVGDKLNRHSGGRESLIVAAEEINSAFDEQGQLVKQISLYVRGDQQSIVNLAFKQNLLLYKKAKCKSKVKYHEEFIVYANNDGVTLPELPSE